MVHSDWKSARDGESGASPTPKLIAAPVACLGVRNALRDAFACEKSAPDDLARLLAKLN